MPLPNCSICFEPLTQPVSLPCGHVFCRGCIRRTVESAPGSSRSKNYGTQHLCPTCRTPYSIVTIDPALVPAHMRPHMQPSIRPLYLDDSASEAADPVPSSSSTTTPPPSDCSLTETHAELAALRLACSVWKRRAEQHAVANHSLLSFARAAKECALRLRCERDVARNRCTLLKRTLAEALPMEACQSGFTSSSVAIPPSSGSSSETSASEPSAGAPCPTFLAHVRAHLTTDAADIAFDTAHARREVCTRAGPGAGGLPVYLCQAGKRPAEAYYDNPADVEASHFGPPIKRRRVVESEEAEAELERVQRARSRSRSPRVATHRLRREAKVGELPTVSLGAIADAFTGS